METTIDTDVLLTREEAARKAGVHPRTISRWKEMGYLHPAVDGRSLRFRSEDVIGLRERHQKRHHWQVA